MGSNICTTTSPTQQPEELYFHYAFAEDTREPTIHHTDEITSTHPIVHTHLQHCQEKLRLSSKLYKDPTMKTDPIILKSLSEHQSELKCTYERPHMFLSSQGGMENRRYEIVDDGDSKSSQIEIKDPILQYFGVFLCFIADRSHLLHQILLTHSNSYGIYVAHLNLASKKEYIYFDDYVLCANRSPIFTQPIKKKYLWPCLLEKVWFKIKEITSKKIQKLSPEEVISTFLSYPLKKYGMSGNRQQNERRLQGLLYGLQKERGCIVTTKMNPLHKLGISGNKHFYLIKAFKFEGKMLYYMRNPCIESIDFRGTHRFPSKELLAFIKDLTKENMPEGNVVLDEQEFMQQVQSFLIVYYSKGSQVVSQEQISISDNTQTFIVSELKKDGLLSIRLDQFGRKQGEYCPLMYHVISLTDNTLVSDDSNDEGCFGVQSTSFFKNVFANLKKGSYLIRIKKKPIKSQTTSLDDKIVVTASTKHKFEYKQQTVFAQQFRAFLAVKGSKILQERASRKFREEFEHVGFWLSDLAVVYIQKRNKQKEEIRMEVHFPELMNLECISHPQLKTEYMAIQPLRDHILIVFQKMRLSDETVLGKYSIESY